MTPRLSGGSEIPRWSTSYGHKLRWVINSSTKNRAWPTNVCEALVILHACTLVHAPSQGEFSKSKLLKASRFVHICPHSQHYVASRFRGFSDALSFHSLTVAFECIPCLSFSLSFLPPPPSQSPQFRPFLDTISSCTWLTWLESALFAQSAKFCLKLGDINDALLLLYWQRRSRVVRNLCPIFSQGSEFQL